MALVLADRVKDTTTTAGTGTITLSGTPPTGYQAFSVIGNGNTTYYTIAGGSQWEVGIGTYTSSGTTLSRDTVLASSAGGTTKVDFAAGTKDVFVTYPAEKAISDGYGTLPVTNGGTGTTTQFTAGSVVFAGTSGVYSQDNSNLFWDDSNKRLGIGTSTPTYSLTIGDSTAPTNLTVLNALITTNTAAGLSVVFRKSADSSNGPNIGWAKSRGTAASPTAVNSGDTAGILTFYGYGGTNYRGIATITGSVETYTSDTNLSGYISFSTNSGGTSATEKMRLTAAGNLGLGVTPAGWQWVALQTQRAAFSGGNNDRAEMSYNYVRTSGTNQYIASDFATNYQQISGQHIWYNAPSGTAGGTISFTQAMTLSAAGGLSVGTTTDAGAGKILAAKGILPRVNAQTTTTSPWAWNSDDYDQQSFSALANALTINADAGTPTDGEKQILRFKDNATPRTLTFTGGSSKAFRDMTGQLTVSGSNWTYTTVASKTVYFGCVYNNADSRWDIIAVTQEP